MRRIDEHDRSGTGGAGPAQALAVGLRRRQARTSDRTQAALRCPPAATGQEVIR